LKTILETYNKSTKIRVKLLKKSFLKGYIITIEDVDGLYIKELSGFWKSNSMRLYLLLANSSLLEIRDIILVSNNISDIMKEHDKTTNTFKKLNGRFLK